MLRVLLVEDEALISLVISIALEDAGYHVTVAMDGLEGLRIAQQDQPELIITDFMMPRMTGLELIRALREAGFTRPIILATSIPEENLPEQTEYDAYIHKPYGEADVLAAIARVTASGARNNTISTNVSACTIPASGLVPPLRMLVAVRAIAPVAAKPPKNGVAMLARPCPTSSWFESCRVPAIPSATTADSSDSIAPSMAMVKAGPTSSSARATVSSGTLNEGRPCGMPPNALPMVLTPSN